MHKSIYYYDSLTGEYCGQGIAPLNPRGTRGTDDEFLLPAHATFTPPFELDADHRAVVFKDGAWSIVPDWRGSVFWDTITRGKHEIKNLEDEPASTWTTKQPLDPESTFINNDWEIPLEVLRTRKIREIRQEADQAAYALKINYSQTEFDTWSRQESGARWLSDYPDSLADDAQFVRDLADARGIPVADLVHKILNAVNNAITLSAQTVGKQQRLEDAINQATTQEELMIINW